MKKSKIHRFEDFFLGPTYDFLKDSQDFSKKCSKMKGFFSLEAKNTQKFRLRRAKNDVSMNFRWFSGKC